MKLASPPPPAATPPRRDFHQFLLDIHDELIVDFFAGGGGASTGIYWALNRHVDHAVNHSRAALGMHRINHETTIHHETDVFEICPLTITQGRRVGLGWFSPDCTQFSKAKGGTPVDKKIRSLAWVLLLWAKVKCRVMIMENVEEIQKWGPVVWVEKKGVWGWWPDPKHEGRTWEAFKRALGPGLAADHPDVAEIMEVLGGRITREELVRGFGYNLEHREIRAHGKGAPTIRNRLFMIARCDGKPIVWPEDTHALPCDLLKWPDRKPARMVAECLDFTLDCPSIFLTKEEAKARGYKVKRPLVYNTMRRAAKGVDRYVLKAAKPFIVCLTHHGGDRCEDIDEPAKTITGANRGEKALVDVTLAPFLTEHANGSRQRVFSAAEPMRTQCAEIKGGHFAMAQVKLRGTNIGHPTTEPLHTISSQGQHHATVSCSLIRHFGQSVGQAVTEPAPCTTAGGGGHTGVVETKLVAPNLTVYYGNAKEGAGVGQGVETPMRSATGTARFADVQSELAPEPLTPEQRAGAQQVAEFLRSHGVEFEGEFATVAGFVIVDIGLRMLTPRELFLAQGFPPDYVIDWAMLVDPKTGEVVRRKLTKEEQIHMCGNSVSPPVAASLVAANVPEMIVKINRPRRAQPTAKAA